MAISFFTNESTAAIAGTPSAESTVEGTNGLDRDAFMRLLVAELQNQDPLDPMDSREMVSQLSELTSVERLEGIEDKIASLESVNRGIASSQVASFLGKEVVAEIAGPSLDGETPGPTEELRGTVTGVEYVGNTPNLIVQGQQVPLDAVLSVGTASSEDASK